MDFFKKPVFYLIILVAITIAATWTYFSDKKKNSSLTSTQETQEDVISNLTNLDPADFDNTVKQEYSLAVEKAKAVKSDYKLSMIEVEIENSLTPESVNTRYIFSASKDTKNNWMITISALSGNFIRALVPQEDYAGKLSNIDTAQWKFNYVTALQLAEKKGGLDWRETNTLTGMQLTLKNENNKLIWLVQYNSADSSKTFKFDASSGEEISRQ